MLNIFFSVQSITDYLKKRGNFFRITCTNSVNKKYNLYPLCGFLPVRFEEEADDDEIENDNDGKREVKNKAISLNYMYI